MNCASAESPINCFVSHRACQKETTVDCNCVIYAPCTISTKVFQEMTKMMVRSPEKAGSLSIGRIVIPKEEQSTGKERNEKRNKRAELQEIREHRH